MKFPDECPYAVWNKGCKIPKSNYYPERAWGHYLPGDEPGWDCELLDGPCQPDNCPDEQTEEE